MALEGKELSRVQRLQKVATFGGHLITDKERVRKLYCPGKSAETYIPTNMRRLTQPNNEEIRRKTSASILGSSPLAKMVIPKFRRG